MGDRTKTDKDKNKVEKSYKEFFKDQKDRVTKNLNKKDKDPRNPYNGTRLEKDYQKMLNEADADDKEYDARMLKEIWEKDHLTVDPKGIMRKTVKSGGKVKKYMGGGKVYASHNKRYAHGGKVSGRKAKYND